MKKIFNLLLFFVLILTIKSFPFGAEFRVMRSSIYSTVKFNISISTSQYAWSKNGAGSIILIPNYSFSTQYGLSNIYFDAPDNQDGAPNVMPWGLMTILIDVTDANGNSLKKSGITIDFRDENWETGYGSSIDTRAIIDSATNNIYLSKDDAIDASDILVSGQTINIWDFWNRSNHFTGHFKVPVTLSNKIEENQNTSFGYLNANGHQVNSGDYDLFNYNYSQSVSEGTQDTVYNSQRHYSFVWSPNQFVTSGGGSLYSSSFDFTVQIEKSTKSITRNFRKVYPLTIKNSLDEAGGITTSNIYFKDPISDNTYHSYSTGSSGYVKDNAFDSLSILVGTSPNQKYSIKASDSFSYNGRNYYWYSGDFSTSGTDILITGTTTKTAYYKGTQLSSKTDAIAGNGQRKIVKTSNGYLH